MRAMATSGGARVGTPMTRRTRARVARSTARVAMTRATRRASFSHRARRVVRSNATENVTEEAFDEADLDNIVFADLSEEAAISNKSGAGATMAPVGEEHGVAADLEEEDGGDSASCVSVRGLQSAPSTFEVVD